MSRNAMRRHNDEKIVKRRLDRIPRNKQAVDYDPEVNNPSILKDSKRFWRRCTCSYCADNRAYHIYGNKKSYKNKKEPSIKDYYDESTEVFI